MGDSEQRKVAGREIEDPAIAEKGEFIERKPFTHRLYRHFSFSLFGLSILAIPVGIVTAYGAWGFRETVGLLGLVFRGDEWADNRWLSLIEISAGGLLFGVVLHFLGWERFRTPAHVIVAASENDGVLRAKDGLLTTVADGVALALAAPVGRYGPAVYLGATLGSVIAQLLRLGRTSIRILLGCGVAAAISAAFNAPIAGVIFAHEVIIGHFRLRAFAPITLASVAAVAVTRSHNVEYVGMKLWTVPHPISLVDYPVYLAIGLASALIAMVYMSGIVNATKIADRFRIPLWSQPLVGGLIAGTIALGWPQILGMKDEVFLAVLEQDPAHPRYGIAALAILCGAKLIGSVCCLGLRYPGGAFTPAMFVGAMFGAIVGMLVPSIDSQIAVLVGMGALVGAVIGAPLAVILIVFELTENYQAATAVMVGVVASNAIVTRFFARSLFHRQIRFWGIEINRSPEQKIMAGRSVSEIMRRDFISLRADQTVGETRLEIAKRHRRPIFVVDAADTFLGRLSVKDGEDPADDTRIGDLVEDEELVFSQEDSLWNVFEKLMGKEDLSVVPVVENDESPRLVGVAHASAVMLEYRKALRRSRKDESEEQGL